MSRGVWMAIAAYVMWGVFPIYFKLIKVVPPLQILAHRIAWSALLLIVVISLRKEWQRVLPTLRNRRVLLVYTGAAVLLAVNWGTYVWAVNSGFVIDASLGYFLNPLVSVMLGVLLLKERLRLGQWIPIGLAAVGVLYITLTLGTLPWIALVLAISFALYGLIKKLAPLEALYSLTLETLVLVVVAVGFLVFSEVQGVGALGHDGFGIDVMLALTGVITVVPLLCFSIAARQIPLSLLGILQFITPTMQFLLGVLLFGETLSLNKLIGFVFIWGGLIIYTIEGFYTRRRLATQAEVSGIPPAK